MGSLVLARRAGGRAAKFEGSRFVLKRDRTNARILSCLRREFWGGQICKFELTGTFVSKSAIVTMRIRNSASTYYECFQGGGELR